MKTRSTIAFHVSTFLLLAGGLLAGPTRQWTDARGRTMMAELLHASGTTVRFAMENGKEIAYPIAKLSAADRDFLADWREKNAHKERPQQPAIPENFGEALPGLVTIDTRVPIEVVSEDPGARKFVYRSPHYEFVSDVRLSTSVVKKFAVMFESTREYCRLLPISSAKAHLAGTVQRNPVLLFETKASYHANGGPPGSAGVYSSRRGSQGKVMVPLTSLGVRKVGSGYMVDHDKSSKTLPHELAHQLTDEVYFAPGARGWFSEGLAEYIAVTPYRSGKFMPKRVVNAVKEYVTEYGHRGQGGRALGDEIKCSPLKIYMLEDYNSFVAKGNINYGLGLLLVTHFLHWDGDGDRTAITSFLKALRAGKQGEAALKELLQGRTWEELQQDIAKAWRSKGVRISFAEPKK